MSVDVGYAVGDALQDAVDELRLALIDGGQVRIGIHDISRRAFDHIPFPERHHPQGESHSDFWAKTGFDWTGKRHLVQVTYFTNEPPA